MSMIPEYTERIALRISTEQKEQSEKLVEQVQFKNLSQVIRAALTEFLSKQEG